MNTWRDPLVAIAVALASYTFVFLTAGSYLSGISIDILFWLREKAPLGIAQEREASVVVVAIDEETHRRTPFSQVPKVMWTPQMGGVQQALLKAGARVIGYDLIFPSTVASAVPNYDREFLKALHQAARDNKVVLGKVQVQNKPIAPHQSQALVVRGSQNIRSVNVFPDADGIIRSAPLFFEAENQDGSIRQETSMSLELAARVLTQVPEFDEDGAVTLGQYRIPGARQNAMLLNFAPGHAIPTFSFADLWACAGEGRADFFKQHFADKVVLFGLVTDVEDRKLTSKRYITEPEGKREWPRCSHDPIEGLFDDQNARESIPGVYIHATAVSNLLQADALARISSPVSFLIALLLPLFSTMATLAFRPLTSLPVIVASQGVWIAASTWAFAAGVVGPMLPAMVAAILATMIMLAYRYVMIDRDKIWLRNAFRLYLAPAVIEQMEEHGQMLVLGGERREMTFLFTDVAGFTSSTEKADDPAKIARVLNSYLDGVIGIVQKHKGTMTQIIGDAVFAFFGAPLEDSEHPDSAVACAREIAAFGLTFMQGDEPHSINFGVTRVGVHTGVANVGNFGGASRFTYTAIGDAVNTAARLESANKFFGTRICVSEETAKRCHKHEFRTIVSLVAKGQQSQRQVFEPVREEESDPEYLAAYEGALALLEHGFVEEAKSSFEQLAKQDPTDIVVAFHMKRFADGTAGPVFRPDDK